MGSCQRGAQCRFAHDQSELQGLPDLARTKICKQMIQTGRCEDPTCTYAHNREELRIVPGFSAADQRERAIQLEQLELLEMEIERGRAQAGRAQPPVRSHADEPKANGQQKLGQNQPLYQSNLMACGTPVFFVPSLVTTGDYPTMCIPGSPTAVTAPQAPDKPSVMKEPPVTQQVAAQAMQQMNSAAQAHVAQAIRLQAQAKAVAQYIHNHSGGPSNGYSNFNDLTPTGPMSPISSEARTMPEIPAPATEPASKAVGSQREIGSVSVGAVPRGLSGHAALPEDAEAEDEPFLPSEPAQIKLGTLRSLSSNSLPVQVDDDDDMADRGMPGMSSSMAQALKVKNTFYDFETDCTPLGNRLRPICSAAGRLDALAAEEEETALGGSLAPGSLAPGSLAPGPTLSSNAAPGGSDLAHANGLPGANPLLRRAHDLASDTFGTGVYVKNTFIDLACEEEPVASLRAVHTAAGRLDMMWRDDEERAD